MTRLLSPLRSLLPRSLSRSKPSGGVPIRLRVAVALLLGSLPASAADYRWDGGDINLPGAGNGASQGGAGTWSTSIANWDDGTNHVVWPSLATDSNAFFGGTGGLVSLASPITVQNITFESAGYTIFGADANVLTLGGTTPTITAGAGITATISSPISGAGLTKAGDGILTLSGLNSYSGTTVAAGTLRLSGAGTLGFAGSSVSVSSGATLDLNGTSQTVTIAAGGGTIANNSGSGTSTLTLNSVAVGGAVIADSTTVAGGKVAVVIAATTQTLSALNTYSGGTTVNAGLFLYITMTAAGTGPINLSADTSGLLLNSGTMANDITGPGYIFNNTNTGSTIVFTGTVNTGGNVMFRNAGNLYNFASNGNSTLTGIVGGPGGPNQNSAAGRIVKSGAGTLTFAGSNIYTGTTTVSAGTLRLDYSINDNSKLSDTTALILSGGTLNLDGGTHNEVVGSTTLTAGTSSNVTRASGTALLQMNAVTAGASARVTFGAEGIATTNSPNTNGILPWARIGNVWGVNSTNSANGPITAFAAYSNVNRLGGVVPNGIANNVRIISSGASGPVTLAAVPLHQINSLQMDTLGEPGTIVAANATDVFMVGDEAGGTIWQTGTSGQLTIGASANSGILTTGNTSNAANATLTVINDSTQNAITINSIIANNDTDRVGLAKTGDGTLQLNGNNTFTGVLSVGSGSPTPGGGGTLVLAGNHSGAMGNVTVGNGATLQLESPDALATTGATGSQLQIFDRSTLNLRADNSVTFSGTNSLGGLNNANVTIDVNRLTAAGTGNTLSISPNGSIYANNVIINVTGGNGYRLSLGAFTGIGNNLLTLNPTTASITLAGYGVSGTGARPSTVTLGGTASGNIVSGAILDPVAPSTGLTKVVKSGSSTWELPGTNTYTGTTIISEGELVVSGSISGSAVTVNGTGVLSGGSLLTPGITGPVTVATGGTLSPGTGIGALSMASLSMSGPSVFSLEINTSVKSTDLVASAGAFTLSADGAVTLTVRDLAPSSIESGTFPFISYASLSWNGGLFRVNGTTITDYDALTNPNSTTFSVSGNTYRIDYNANDTTAALIAVPEPNTVMMMIAGMTVLAASRRRRVAQR